MARKGKAMSKVTYNPEDRPKAYSNPAVHIRLTEYTAMTKEVHGPDSIQGQRTSMKMSP
jgi:hypothetical protein